MQIDKSVLAIFVNFLIQNLGSCIIGALLSLSLCMLCYVEIHAALCSNSATFTKLALLSTGYERGDNVYLFFTFNFTYIFSFHINF